MRQTQIFAGSSHPQLVESICERLGQSPAKADLGKFANGETKVQLNTSIRDQDVFIIQSGSSKINDNVIELLIMVSACKGGSAKSVTAVLPYFPYSRQSKKKSHRGAITARMVANLLDVAGVNHIITIDLHASQMQGFFSCPVDNLVAEPLIAHWIKQNIADWKKAVVVSKNPGGTKRVTSLADALKLNFGIVMTDRKRGNYGGSASMSTSILIEKANANMNGGSSHLRTVEYAGGKAEESEADDDDDNDDDDDDPYGNESSIGSFSLPTRQRSSTVQSSAGEARSNRSQHLEVPHPLTKVQTAPSAARYDGDEDSDDPRIRDIVTGRLIHGHIVDDDVPSPSTPTSLYPRKNSDDDPETVPEHMLSSFYSVASSLRATTEHALGLGGSGDAAASSDEEEDATTFESTVTLVGNVKNKPVIILDDMIDKCGSWIAAAETVVKRGGATQVYCVATHGLFGGDCLQEMEECDCIDGIVVTNAFPIPAEKVAASAKLVVLDVSWLLSEAIRRNHHGESINMLYQHYD